MGISLHDNILDLAYCNMRGLPAVITTNQGTEFKLNDKLMKTFNMDHQLMKAHHPQANGLDERLSEILTNSIVKYVETDHQIN